MSTSARIHGGSAGSATRRTVRWFAQLGDDQPSDDAFKFRRGAHIWQTRTAIGHAAAVAVAQRAELILNIVP